MCEGVCLVSHSSTFSAQNTEIAVAARDVLDAVTITTMSTDTFERAALLEPVTMRSLDALHLAAALALGDDLGAVITYDARLAEAARSAGIRMIAPGA